MNNNNNGNVSGHSGRSRSRRSDHNVVFHPYNRPTPGMMGLDQIRLAAVQLSSTRNFSMMMKNPEDQSQEQTVPPRAHNRSEVISVENYPRHRSGVESHSASLSQSSVPEDLQCSPQRFLASF